MITGGSSGIGACSATYLADRGARVVITARGAERLELVAAEIRAHGGEVLAIPGDVTHKEDMERVATAAEDHFGPMDTWVNNAGVYLQGRIQDITPDEYRRVLEVNLIGVINGTQCALTRMLPRRSGVIVQISSIAAGRGVPYTTAYSASKGGIGGFTSALRAELRGSGVRLSILYPPTVDTPIYQHGRGKLGVVPKPAPPVADPLTAAREIAKLAMTGARHAYFGWSRPLQILNELSPAAADWLLHRATPLTYSDLPSAGKADNLDLPSLDHLPRVRGGWTQQGWKGLTFAELTRVFPAASLLGAATLGFIGGRMSASLIARALAATDPDGA